MTDARWASDWPDKMPGKRRLATRRDDVRHMCPECGNPPHLFCPLCLGVGTITDDQLDRWQARQNLTLGESTGLLRP